MRGQGELCSLCESPNAKQVFRFNEIRSDAFWHCSLHFIRVTKRGIFLSTKLKRITVSLRNEDVEFLEKNRQKNGKPLSKNLVNYFRLGVKRSKKTNTDYLKFQAELQNLNNEIRKLGTNINQISANLNYARKHGGMNDVINQVYSNYDYSDKILFLTMDLDKLIEKVAKASGN